MRALVIGAGNIGLGFLGYLLWKSGLYEITFIEAQPERVKLLNDMREYVVVTVGSAGSREEVIGPVNAISALDSDAVMSAVVDADLVLTAVGKPNLIRVAPLLGEGLVQRLQLRPRSEMHLVVVACENVYDNTRYLEGLILEALPEEQRSSIHNLVSFPSCMVDRIVPSSTRDTRHPLVVTVEEYFQFVVDGTALKGAFPAVPGIEISTSLPAKLEQKLFTLNMLHGIVGYWGTIAGYQFVHEAIGDSRVVELARGSLREVSQVLCSRHPSIDAASQEKYGETIIDRFRNPHLRDPLLRVTSQPIRKLGVEERLIKPARLALEQDLIPSHLATGIAAAFRYSNGEDAEAVRLSGRIRDEGIDRTIQNVAGLDQAHPLTQLIKADFLLSSLR
ncbi:MAG: mannitol-1-phosphate 5-dehydrogenase [Candidatus Liptonbacteria bacterium]|nr:mannitol-1-phosphate 5-dehydrogenase [Parcubacteria group bacterium]MBI4087333.1 mannitol-1-phosphate 5-dehydrogenase [Candidatus Liptonbacteria bacterium]